MDVLNKVKELFLIPKLEMMTAQMVADFYEVNSETIRQVYHRNQTEIDPDGVMKYSPKDFERDMLSRVKIERSPIVGKVGYTTFIVDGDKVTLGNGCQRYFSPRAVLRIGMLLRDSEVAKEVRTQLLKNEKTYSTLALYNPPLYSSSRYNHPKGKEMERQGMERRVVASNVSEIV